MVTFRSQTRTVLALSTIAATAFGIPAVAQAASAATTTNCTNTPFRTGGTYEVQPNEWASGENLCITSDGGTDFSVASSGLSNATDGPPGSYSFIYSGCYRGTCTPTGLGVSPPALRNLTAGSLTTSVSANSANGVYNTAYDIWTATRPDTSKEVTGTEIMIWLNRQGHIQPAGAPALTGVQVGGVTYDVWRYPHPNGIGSTVTFLATSPVTSMSGVDVHAYTQYVLDRGWAKPDWYLTSVDAGFEIWQAGAGLRVNSFGVTDRVVPQSARKPAPPPVLVPKQGPRPAAAHTTGLDFGPGVKNIRLCGTTTETGKYGCTGWSSTFGPASRHVVNVFTGHVWKRGKFTVEWNGGGKGNSSSCDTSGRYAGSLRGGKPGAVILGTSRYPVGPGHSEC